MARVYVTPPCGRPETFRPAKATPGFRVKANPMVPIEHQRVQMHEGEKDPRDKTFTHAGVPNSVTAMAVWVGADGHFRFLLQNELKKIGPVVTSASGFLSGAAEEKNPQDKAQRKLASELGVKVTPDALAHEPVVLTDRLLAYPNTTGEAYQQAFGFFLKKEPEVLADKDIWSEDLCPRSLEDFANWQGRIGTHGPVVTAVLAMGQWLQLAGYATPTGKATPQALALCD